jgi:carbonic anhydrase
MTRASVLRKNGQFVGPDQALQMLKDGNKKYVAGHRKHPRDFVGRLHKVAFGQNPFAVVLGCADSRVPVEIIFHVGLGDLFVVRVAGNVADHTVIGSIEFAVEQLGTRLVVVLGHERCGAITSAVNGGRPRGHIGTLLDHLKPVVKEVRSQTGDTLDLAVRLNAVRVAEKLQLTRPILSKAVTSGKIKIVAARYDLDDGNVEFLTE